MSAACLPHVAAIGLGSNLGDRLATIEQAVARLDALAEMRVKSVSRLVETEPVGPPGQRPYLNGAALLRTSLSPRALLEACLAVEAAHGRVRGGADRWGPRTLDLDLLLYDQLVIDEPGLTIPHPRMHQRLFVLVPLAEIAGSWVHPVCRVPIEWLLAEARAVAPAE